MHTVSGSIRHLASDHLGTYGKVLTTSSQISGAFFLLFKNTYADEE